MLRGRLAVWSFAALGVLIVAGVGLVLFSVFAPRPRPTPAPTPMPTPSSSADRIALQDDFRRYLEAHVASTPGGGTAYCTWELLGDEDVSGGVDAYVWTHCEEYLRLPDAVTYGARMIVPTVLHAQQVDDEWVVVGHDAPRTGDGYARDVRRLFPRSLHRAILGPGAVGAFPYIPRVRALEDFRLPLRYHPDVVVLQPSPQLEQVAQGTLIDVPWTVSHARASAPDGAADCVRFRATPETSTEEDRPALDDETCVAALYADTAVDKVTEALVGDALFGWTVGRAARDADEVELTFTDQTLERVPVRRGVWAAVYPSVRYPIGVTARGGGLVLGSCGMEDAPNC